MELQAGRWRSMTSSIMRSVLSATTVLAALALAAPAPASAATFSQTDRGSYAEGQVSLQAGDVPLAVHQSSAGEGLTRVEFKLPAGRSWTVNRHDSPCTVDDAAVTVTCVFAFEGLHFDVFGTAAADKVVVDGQAPLDPRSNVLNVALGAGDDVVDGRDGNARIRFEDAAGSDTVFGGSGNDVFRAGAGPDGNDTFDASAPGDLDTVDYSSRGHGVTLDGTSGAAQGGPGESDSITSAEILRGTAHADVLRVATGAPMTVLLAGAGDDTLFADDGVFTEAQCDEGTDTIKRDPVDTVSGCENDEVIAGAGDPTVNVHSPAVLGDPIEGRTLSATDGAWNGTGPFAYAYQWQRCADVHDEASCVDIDGATSSTYVVGGADADHALRVSVAATGRGGTAHKPSAMTEAAVALPYAKPRPTIEDVVPVAGTPIHGDAGAWYGTGPIALAFQWLRCPAELEAEPIDCVRIPNALALSYVPTAADTGQRLRLEVTGTNRASAPIAEITGPTAIVAGAPAAPAASPAPKLVDEPTAAPALTAGPGAGAPTANPVGVGRPVRVDVGRWTDATSFAVQFERCESNDAHTCKDIPGATGVEYIPTAADAGKRLRARVSARSAAGATTIVHTAMSAAVAGPLPGAADPTPAALPATPAAAQPTTMPAPAPAAAPAPTPGPCVSRRAFTVHWSVPARTRLRSVTVRIDGRIVRRLAGGTRRARIDLAGRTAGPVTVAITATTSRGRTLRTVRTYRLCTPRQTATALKTIVLGAAQNARA